MEVVLGSVLGGLAGWGVNEFMKPKAPKPGLSPAPTSIDPDLTPQNQLKSRRKQRRNLLAGQMGDLELSESKLGT